MLKNYVFIWLPSSYKQIIPHLKDERHFLYEIKISEDLYSFFPSVFCPYDVYSEVSFDFGTIVLIFVLDALTDCPISFQKK